MLDHHLRALPAPRRPALAGGRDGRRRGPDARTAAPGAAPRANGMSRRTGRARIVVDGRLLHYNRTGIGRYLRHLYRAIGDLEGQGGLRPPSPGPGSRSPSSTAGATRRARSRTAYPCGTVAWTPGHHPRERWALALEGARLRPACGTPPTTSAPNPWAGVPCSRCTTWPSGDCPRPHSAPSRAYYAGLRAAPARPPASSASPRPPGTTCWRPRASRGRVRVVPEAPDPATCNRRRSLPFPDPVKAGRPYLLCVGTIEPRKNLPASSAPWPASPARGSVPSLRVVGAPGLDATAIQAPPRPPGTERRRALPGPAPYGTAGHSLRRRPGPGLPLPPGGVRAPGAGGRWRPGRR